MKTLLLVIGVMAIAMGLLWTLQGLGYVDWPKSSFMIDQRPWALRGALLMAAGVIVVIVARRRR